MRAQAHCTTQEKRDSQTISQLSKLFVIKKVRMKCQQMKYRQFDEIIFLHTTAYIIIVEIM